MGLALLGVLRQAQDERTFAYHPLFHPGPLMLSLSKHVH